MTVKELIELNNFIGDVSITVRGGDNGSMKLREYRIGVYAGQTLPCPDKRTTCKDVAINARDNGKDYYQILLKQIPKQWLELKVQSFHIHGSYRRNWPQAIHAFEHIYIDVHPEGWMEKVELKKEHDEQLTGQMSLDFPEVMRC